jgi:DNA-binding XRE family transcriptional regulator
MTSEEFKSVRLKLDMNQSQFAELLGMSGKQAISNIETGLRKPGSLTAIMLGALDSLSKRKAGELVELMLKIGEKLK